MSRKTLPLFNDVFVICGYILIFTIAFKDKLPKTENAIVQIGSNHY